MAHCLSGLSLPSEPSTRVLGLFCRLGRKRVLCPKPDPAQPSPALETANTRVFGQVMALPGKVGCHLGIIPFPCLPLDLF